MPEGPSLVLAREALRPFAGLTVKSADGNTTQVDFERLRGTTLKSVRSWGKHLLLTFNKFTLRIHFLMFGSYAIGTPKAGRTPRLAIHFEGGESIFFYTASVKTIEGSLSKAYDWSADVMSTRWSSANAIIKLKSNPKTLICDALLNQEIFSGVGNIIKNEVLFRMRLHPLNKIADIPTERLKAVVDDARVYSFLFLKWKRKFELRKHWEVHTRKKCPRDGHALVRIYPGTTHRRTFFCSHCQELFSKPPRGKSILTGIATNPVRNTALVKPQKKARQ